MKGLRIFLLIGAIAAIVFGVQNTLTSVQNSTPTKIKYTDWIAQRPNAQWLELDDAWIDFRYAKEIQTISKRKGQTTGTVTKREYFAPIYRGRDDLQSVCAFLKCNDQASTSKAMEGANIGYSGEARKRWLAEADGRLNVQCTVRGMVRAGLFDDGDDRRELSKAMRGEADPNFIVIDENEEPHGVEGMALLGLGGVLLLAFAGTLLAKKKQPIYPGYMPPGAQNYLPPQPYPQAGRPTPYSPGPPQPYPQQPQAYPQQPYQPQPGPYQQPQAGPYQPPRPPQV
ncbi:MAG: hypothetical protein IT462_08750 [Planctomycetes bacterium]|nr:hypothetical protein [Planctomycetota bacterium]